MIQLEDIGGESCEPQAGISKIYYAGYEDFESIEDPLDDICCTPETTTFSELVEIPEKPGHVMKEGTRVHRLKMITETGTIKSTLIGEKKRQLFENELTLELAGSNEELLGFLRWIKNQDLVFFIEEFGTGQIRQLGSKRLPARVEGIEHGIEATTEGKNSVALTLKDKQKWPAAIYNGIIVTG